MPQISSYPIISVPGLEDLLIGTDINNLDETKNFRLSDISVLLGSGYVPYTGATGNINLGAFGITSSSFIKSGGTSLQFLKADGSVDATQYTPQSRTITINGVTYDLSANRSWSFGGVDVLTTAGSSGPATYVEGFLNIPQYQPAGNYITSLSGEATGSGPGAAAVTLSNSAVIGKLLTGFNVVAGSIISSDSILQAFGKAQSQINALASGVSFRGTWNASTNTPALASGVGTGGHYYVVSVAGSTSLNGVSTWAVGDWVIFNGVSSVWQRIPNTQLVSSVNGFTGAVSLTSSDVGAAPTSRTLTINGTAFDLSANRSWTVGDIRSDQSYGNPSWITSLDWAKVSGRPSTIAGYGITNAALSTTTITINGIGYDLSANRVWSVGTVTSVSVTGPLTGGTITGSGTIGITQAGPTSSGFLSSADWNMFNSKVSSISATLPLSFTSGTISISQAGPSSDGYLSQSDWNSFNQKQDAIVNPITGIGSAGFLPMFAGPGDLSDSPISYSSNSLLVNYSSTIGNSFVLENTGIGSYSYSILMNNFAINKSTTHFYSEGLIVDMIGGNQVRRVFPNGNTVFGVSTVDNGNKLSVYGTIFSSNISNAAINTDRFLVSDSGVVKYRTASELFSDIGSSRSITINGVSQDLSSDRSWSVGTVTSVSVSAPVGLTVTGSPVTGSGTIAIAFASGYSIPTNGAQASWDIAYNNMIVSAAVTGTTTKTLTLNQQDGGTVTASWVESGGGVSGSGTVNTIPIFTGSATLGDSFITQSSSRINYGTNFGPTPHQYHRFFTQNNQANSLGRSSGIDIYATSSGSYSEVRLKPFTDPQLGGGWTHNVVIEAYNGGVNGFQDALRISSTSVDAIITLNVNGIDDPFGNTTRPATLSLNSGSVNWQLNVTRGSGSDTWMDVREAGTTRMRYISGGRFLLNTTTDNTVDTLQVNGSAIATSYKVTSGTASQFLKANGTLDSSVYLTANQTITLSGDVTGSGATSISTTIANNAVSLAKMAQISTARILGRVTAATGNVESLTGTQVTTLLDTFTSTLKGLVPSPGSVGSTRFLREDGTWVVPSGGGGGVTGSGTISYVPKFTSASAIGDSSIIDTANQTYIRSGVNAFSPPFPYSFTGDYKTIIGGGGGFNLSVGNNGGFWLQLDSRDDAGNLTPLRIQSGQEVSVTSAGTTVGQISFSVFGTSSALIRNLINNVNRFQIGGSLVESFVSLRATSLIKSGATNSDVLYGDGSTKKITSGTAAPSGGSDGDIYLQYV